MWGAILGDIAGSRFEWNRIKTEDFEFFGPKCEYTDDSVCTAAVAEILLDDLSSAATLQRWCRCHPGRGYGGMFAKWIETDDPAPYGSFGNGAAMRVSPAAFLHRHIVVEDALKAANRVTAITHNHPEGMKGPGRPPTQSGSRSREPRPERSAGPRSPATSTMFPRASQSRYTLFRPSDCPNNRDHLKKPSKLPNVGDARQRATHLDSCPSHISAVGSRLRESRCAVRAGGCVPMRLGRAWRAVSKCTEPRRAANRYCARSFLITYEMLEEHRSRSAEIWRPARRLVPLSNRFSSRFLSQRVAFLDGERTG